MTTESKQVTRPLGVSVLLGAASVAGAVGILVVALGAVISGSDGALGAATGVGVVLAVFVLGALAVNLIAGLMPAVSLLVALLTYTCQLVVVLVVFVSLSNGETFAEEVVRAWLAVAVVGTTLAWLTAQIVFTTRQRIPIYDLPEEPAVHGRTGGES